MAAKEYHQARRCFNECIKLGEEFNFSYEMIEAKIHLAQINLLENEADESILILRTVLKDARCLKLNDLVSESGLLLSKCYTLKDMPDKAAAVEKRIKSVINKLDSVWLYEKNRQFERLFRQLIPPISLKEGKRGDTFSPSILTDALNQHYETSTHNHIVGKSVPMLEVYQLIEKIAPTDLPVLIQGETGTGKELIAHLIHTNSQIANNTYLPFNCGVLPETLVESHLFGHTKGAFTDAKEDKKGYIELASGGTLFVDEIANMSQGMQQKLLRVLEEKKVWLVGAEKPITIDTRFIFASNQDIEQMVKQKS